MIGQLSELRGQPVLVISMTELPINFHSSQKDVIDYLGKLIRTQHPDHKTVKIRSTLDSPLYPDGRIDILLEKMSEGEIYTEQMMYLIGQLNIQDGKE